MRDSAWRSTSKLDSGRVVSPATGPWPSLAGWARLATGRRVTMMAWLLRLDSGKGVSNRLDGFGAVLRPNSWLSYRKRFQTYFLIQYYACVPKAASTRVSLVQA